MKILAVDTSTWAMAASLSSDGQLVAEMNTYLHKNHALRLMPAIDHLCSSVDVTPSELDLIAVGSGPGSYTGVRIGVTVAKTLAWTLGRPLLSLSSLQVIAQTRVDFNGVLVPILDARRGNVYAGQYRSEGRTVTPIAADRIQPLNELLHEVGDRKEALLFLGPGIEVHGEAIVAHLGERGVLAEERHFPMGRALAALAWRYREEAIDDPHRLVPRYLQMTEAEKKWLEKNR